MSASGTTQTSGDVPFAAVKSTADIKRVLSGKRIDRANRFYLAFLAIHGAAKPIADGRDIG